MRMRQHADAAAVLAKSCAELVELKAAVLEEIERFDS